MSRWMDNERWMDIWVDIGKMDKWMGGLVDTRWIDGWLLDGWIIDG